MTDLIEARLRELFAEDADHAPVVTDLAGSARGMAQRQTRRRAAVVGSGVLVALLVGSAAVLSNAQSGHGSAPTASKPPTSAPSISPSTTSTPTTEEPSALYYRNVEVPVPAAMLDPHAVSRCGNPVADAAYVSTGSHRACLIEPAHPGQLTTVVLQPTKTLPTHWAAGTRVLPDGRTEVSSGVPGGDLTITVTSPDPKRANRLFNGLRIVDRARGCPVSDPATRSSAAPDPGEVSGGSVCAYQDGWLVNSSWLDGTQGAEVADLLKAPIGSYVCLNPLGTTVLDHWDVRLRTPTGEVVTRVPGACPGTTLTKRLWALAGPQG